MQQYWEIQCHQSNFNRAMNFVKRSGLRKGLLLISMGWYSAVLQIPVFQHFWTELKISFKDFAVETILLSLGTGLRWVVLSCISKHNGGRMILILNRDTYWHIPCCMDESSMILRFQDLWEQYIQWLNSEGTTGSAENGKYIWPHTGQHWQTVEYTGRTRATSREF